MTSLILIWGVFFFVFLLVGLGTVAFITLLERKLLGLRQTRLGPNKVSLIALIQPVADGLKLLFKQFLFVTMRQRVLFFSSPLMLLMLFFIMWSLVLPWRFYTFLCYRAFLLFCFLGVGAYSIIVVGWSRVRIFSKLGCMRSILQRLSFEITLILLFIVILRFFNSFRITIFTKVFRLAFVWTVLWAIISLIERNRAPFDLLEGERELIRGFNVEIRRLAFVYIFLREYGILAVLSIILAKVAFSEFFLILRLIAIHLLVLIRSCFPRVRWDLIITFIWKGFLPLSVLIYLIGSFFSF